MCKVKGEALEVGTDGAVNTYRWVRWKSEGAGSPAAGWEGQEVKGMLLETSPRFLC